MRIGLFFKYDREFVNGSENQEIPDLWGRVDRYDNVDPDQTPHYVASDLGLHCLSMTLLQVSR